MNVIYTTESKGFEATDGDYAITGNKVSNEGVFLRVDAGYITNGNTPVASYSHGVDNGEIVNLAANFFFPEQAEEILALIKSCFKALNGENE